MKISPAGRDLIARNEGLRLEAYRDVVGVWTIGYGDTGPDVVEGLTITKAEAIRRLDDRLEREFGAAVNKGIGSAPTTQGQFDAMVSLAYNIGVGAFRKSSVRREHVAGNYEAAADAFLMWNKAGGTVWAGLTRRRGEERKLYLSDVPSLPEPEVEDDGREMLAAAIRVLQLHMRHYGHYKGEIDGIWGPQSAAAVREFQSQ